MATIAFASPVTHPQGCNERIVRRTRSRVNVRADRGVAAQQVGCPMTAGSARARVQGSRGLPKCKRATNLQPDAAANPSGGPEGGSPSWGLSFEVAIACRELSDARPRRCARGRDCQFAAMVDYCPSVRSPVCPTAAVGELRERVVPAICGSPPPAAFGYPAWHVSGRSSRERAISTAFLHPQSARSLKPCNQASRANRDSPSPSLSFTRVNPN